MRELINSKLTNKFSPLTLEVLDESHLHKGHAGARPEGETHFRVTIKSAMFEGKSSLECHKLVYDVLAEEMKNRIHALAIKIVR